MSRPCLRCGQPVQGRSRCPSCTPVKAKTTARGYGARWQRIARRAIAAHPWCEACGATADLTADHVVPLARGGDESMGVRVLCRPCNARRGAGEF